MIRKTKQHMVVFVTAPSASVARKVARAVLTARLAACVNILPGVESHYWWQGKLERSPELMLVIKTTRKCLAALTKAVHGHHPYDTPEVVACELDSGSAKYLDWLDASVGRHVS